MSCQRLETMPHVFTYLHNLHGGTTENAQKAINLITSSLLNCPDVGSELPLGQKNCRGFDDYKPSGQNGHKTRLVNLHDICHVF
jgi:hypothetical protein